MSEGEHDREVVLARYAGGPAWLEVATAGLDEAELDLALDAESWTIRQIVHHVVDGDDIWKTFVKMALGHSEAPFTLQWYWDIPQMTWAERWAYADRGIEPSLALFAANRRHVLQLLETSPDAWECSLAIHWSHKEAERITVGWVIAMQADHVMGHIEDIRKIRQAHSL